MQAVSKFEMRVWTNNLHTVRQATQIDIVLYIREGLDLDFDIGDAHALTDLILSSGSGCYGGVSLDSAVASVSLLSRSLAD